MIKNLLLLVFSSMLTLFAFESVLRIIYDPIDYLWAKPSEHSFLNHKIDPFVGGHDKWGFRNTSVPEQAEIVAIGDSMTYGVSAKSTMSWPAHLSRKLGSTVYNLSLGGYGPLHYLYLLERYALELNPDTLILGVYLGNDLTDAYNLAYSNDNWLEFRKSPNSGTIESLLSLPEIKEQKSFSAIRNFFSENSVLYRMVTQSSYFDQFRIKESQSLNSSVVVIEEHGSTMLLDPIHAFRRVNDSDKRLREAIGITKSAISKVKRICDTNSISLLVVVIPIKENVYREQILATGSEHSGTELAQNLDSLDRVRSTLFDFFKNNGIQYVNVLPAFKVAIKEKTIYPPSDGHPNSVGYEIISQEIQKSLLLL